MTYHSLVKGLLDSLLDRPCLAIDLSGLPDEAMRSELRRLQERKSSSVSLIMTRPVDHITGGVFAMPAY